MRPRSKGSGTTLTARLLLAALVVLDEWVPIGSEPTTKWQAAEGKCAKQLAAGKMETNGRRGAAAARRSGTETDDGDDGSDAHYPCTAGFAHYSGSCYRIVPPSKSAGLDRTEAQSECARFGSHLVTIESRGEQRYLQNVLRYYTAEQGAYWMGAQVDTKGRWRWDVGLGSRTRALSFTDWAMDEDVWAYEVAARHGAGGCALLDPADDHRWMFWPCDSKQFPGGSSRSVSGPIGAICERPRTSRPCSKGSISSHRSRSSRSPDQVPIAG